MGEMCDFEAEYFPENWDIAAMSRRKKSPKERVVARYPKAYAVKGESMAFVYRGPASAAPRGRETAAIVLGAGSTVRSAWLDASNKLPPRGKAAKRAL